MKKVIINAAIFALMGILASRAGQPPQTRSDNDPARDPLRNALEVIMDEVTR